MKKKIAIIGAGPGGLTAAMILSKRGYEVDVYEKDNHVWGRNSRLTLSDKYHFDVGPTFLLMKDILDEVFEFAWAKSSDYLDFEKIDPMYELHFEDKTVPMTSDYPAMRETIARMFPGEEKWFDTYISYEEKRLQRMYPCLKADYGNVRSILKNSWNLLRVLPYLSLGKSIYDVLGSYFKSEELKLCFTFQAKYLGMSPWNCPGFFSMLAYAEHKYGIYHTTGWLSQISEAMKKVAEKNGAKIHLNSPVKKVVTKNKKATGIELMSGEIKSYDSVVVNADFGHAMTHLFDQSDIAKYSAKKLSKKGFSCSTYMVYLALDKVYDLPFHSIYFAKNYRENLQVIHDHKEIQKDDFSFYIRNASVVDKTLAPEGHSGIYVLVPMSNLRSDDNWEVKKEEWYKNIISTLKNRAGLEDIESHIVDSVAITPADWEKRGVYLGATFNLAHTVDQMLYFRPHNQFECVGNCYLVWGGTHPGSGLPTIYESARIVSDLIDTNK
jgi:phytoene desaturase